MLWWRSKLTAWCGFTTVLQDFFNLLEVSTEIPSPYKFNFGIWPCAHFLPWRVYKISAPVGGEWIFVTSGSFWVVKESCARLYKKSFDKSAVALYRPAARLNVNLNGISVGSPTLRRVPNKSSARTSPSGLAELLIDFTVTCKASSFSITNAFLRIILYASFIGEV